MEIAPGVHSVAGLARLPFAASVFLLVDERLTLVDTGIKGSAPAIERYVKRIGRSMAELDTVVLTHHHSDHVGSLPELRAKYRFRLAAHEAEVPYVEGRVPEATATVSGPIGFGLRLMRPYLRTDPAQVDVVLRDGSELDLLGGVRVVHAPGHSPGNICLYLPRHRLAIVGDTFSIGRHGAELPASMFTEDMEQARASLERLLPLDLEVICPSHRRLFRGDVAGKIRELLARTM